MRYPLIAFINVILVVLITTPDPLHSQEAEPITIGTSYLFETQDAQRHVNVVLPVGYEENGEDYPLIVVLDGGLEQDMFLTLGIARWTQMWGRSAPAIYVGVETVDRQRELLPPTRSASEKAEYPTAGQSAVFRSWLANNVLPMVRKRYRDDGRTFLIGESAAGHFVAETWAVSPDLFSGYAAISPSLQWSNQALARQVEVASERERPPLYISQANEGGATQSGIERLIASAGPNVCFSDRRKELVHANTLHGLFPEALQYLLPTEADWLEEYGLVLRCDNQPAR